MSKFKGTLSQSGFLSKLLLIIGSTFFFTTVALFIWTISTGGNTTNISSLKLLQLLQSVGMFILPPLALAYFWSNQPLTHLQLDKKPNCKNAIIASAIMLTLIPLINLLGDINQQFTLPKALAGVENWMKASEAETATLTKKLLEVHTVSGLLFNIFLIAIIPSLGEELFFRGTIQKLIQSSTGTKTAIWITAIIFSAIHLQFYGFIPRLLLGAFFGYLLVWSGNLWLPILAHFINNCLATIFYYLKTNGYRTIDIDTIGTGKTMWMAFVSGAIAIGGIYWIQKRLQNKISSDQQAL